MTTLGVFKTMIGAKAAIEEMRVFGVPMEDISYIHTNAETDDTVVTTNGDTHSVGEGAASGAATGAVIGAIAGLAVANGILPGLGTLFVAGPIATALGLTGAAATTVAGAATGAAAGTLIGALANLGVDDEDAKAYEESIKSGHVLVVAQTDMNVTDIFMRNGAERVKTYQKTITV